MCTGNLKVNTPFQYLDAMEQNLMVLHILSRKPEKLFTLKKERNMSIIFITHDCIMHIRIKDAFGFYFLKSALFEAVEKLFLNLFHAF